MDDEIVGTADICDLEPEGLRIVHSNLKPLGGKLRVQFKPNAYLWGDEEGLILVNAPLTHISF